MGNLSLDQQTKVIHAINRKELSSAEILLEIYDHYISHLENCDDSRFEEQLNQLEEKFTYNYCHVLQINYNKNIKKELLCLQWDNIKSYFTFPKLIYSIFILSSLLLINLSFSDTENIILFSYIPIILMLAFAVSLIFRHFKKLKSVKKIFSDQMTTISSSVQNQLILSFLFPAMLANAVLSKTNSFFKIHEIYYYMPYLSVAMSALVIVNGVAMLEVWKVKRHSAIGL